MDEEYMQWARDAFKLCREARESGTVILLKHDDAGIFICSSTQPDVITAVGNAWNGCCDDED
jgi:hypothetical protein